MMDTRLHYDVEDGILEVCLNVPDNFNINWYDQLENFTINIEDGTLNITGDKLNWFHVSSFDGRIKYDDYKDTVNIAESSLYEARRFYIVGPYEKYIKQGYYIKKEKTRIDIKTSNFRIKDFSKD